jgi:hypothetical protein
MTQAVFEEVKGYIHLLGDEIKSEFKGEETWEIHIKRGDFIVSLRQSAKIPFIDVIFPSPFKDDALLKRLDRFFDTPSHMVRLLSFLTSPDNSFNIIKEKDDFAGFNVMAKVFPHDGEYRIKDLDQGIRSVISAGAMGFMYIQLCVSEVPVTQKIVHEDSVDRMFQ